MLWRYYAHAVHDREDGYTVYASPPDLIGVEMVLLVTM